jgi:hypothetical protein
MRIIVAVKLSSAPPMPTAAFMLRDSQLRSGTYS